MSVIQKIRDKYARWAVVAIALSLLGFIMMDAFAGKTGLFSNQRQGNTLAKVNGVAINRIEFDNKVKLQEEQAASQNYQLDDQQRQQMMESLWNQEVTDIVMKSEYEKLGLTVTDKELRDILYGANPPQDIKQQFTDPKTGKFNSVAAQQEINKARKDPTRKDQIEKYLDYLKSQRLMSKYMAMLLNTINFPKWFLEKRNVDNSLIGKISFVSIPYATIPDSTIRVSDQEIQDFIKAHKADYEQKEEKRSISYVLFSAAPSAADSAAAKKSLLSLRNAFDSTKDMKQFIETNGNTFPFYDSYLAKSALPMTNKDSVVAAPVGTIYGPYVEVDPNGGNGYYVMTKIIGVKQLPDTVKVRHILVATTQQSQTGELMQVREDSTAKHLIDSIQGLLDKGQNFDSLVVKFSDDPGSKEKGGVYENIIPGKMTPAFNDFIFEHKTGERGIVKTEVGYHLIEILSQKGSSPAYKIASVTKPILTSAETDQAAHNEANLFAGDSRDLSSFNANYEKKLRSKGIPKLMAPDITPMQYNIQGLQASARTFIKSVFDADKGDVLGPDRVGDNYIVAIITEINEPGLQGVNSVRSLVEPLIRNRKKAEEITKKIGKITTPEEIGAKMNQPVRTVDSLRFGGDQKLGFEPKVLGAAFNPANKGKVIPEAIAGTSGVFVVRVENITTTPVEAANIADQQKMFEMQMKQGIRSQMQRGGTNPIIDALKNAAKIKDNRANFY